METSKRFLKDMQKLYEEFFSTDEILQKYYAYSFMRIFHEFYSADPIVNQYFQEMKKYIKKHYSLITRVLDLDDKHMDQYLQSKMSFFEKKLPKVKGLNIASNYSFVSINEMDASYLLDSFLWSISHKLYNFYKKIKRESKVLMRNPESTATIGGLKPGEQNGFAVSASTVRRKSYVFMNKMNSLEDLSGLVHEIGHAYFYHIVNYSFKDFLDPEKNLKKEIPSRMLEYLFIQYLKKLNILDANMLEEMFYDTMQKDRYASDLLERYKYSIGNTLAVTFAKDINKKVSLEKFYRSVYLTPLDRIIEKTSCDFEEKQKIFEKVL